MNERRLSELIQRDRSLLHEPRRLRAILSDLFPDEPAEIWPLFLTAQAGIPLKLLSMPQGKPNEERLKILTRQTAMEMGVEEGWAAKAIAAWNAVLELNFTVPIVSEAKPSLIATPSKVREELVPVTGGDGDKGYFPEPIPERSPGLGQKFATLFRLSFLLVALGYLVFLLSRQWPLGPGWSGFTLHWIGFLMWCVIGWRFIQVSAELGSERLKLQMPVTQKPQASTDFLVRAAYFLALDKNENARRELFQLFLGNGQLRAMLPIREKRVEVVPAAPVAPTKSTVPTDQEKGEVAKGSVTGSLNEFLRQAKAAEEGGDSALALEIFAKALKHPGGANDFRINYGRANLLYRVGQYEKALADYDRVIALHPANPNHYYNRGMVHKKLNRRGDAMRDFQNGRRLNPKDPDFEIAIRELAD